MKKLLLIGMVLAIMVCPVSAANHSKVVETVETSSRSVSLAVSETDTIYTRSFPIKSANTELDIGVAYLMSPATGDTAIYFQQSVQKPATEGASDVTYMITEDINTSLTDGSWHLATIDTVDLMYGRFKITGQNSNPKTTVLTIKTVK